MTLDDKRWAIEAHELKFHQLEMARRQAESWRTALTGITTLVGAVLIVKGRDNFGELADPYRWIVTGTLGVCLTLLMSATILSIRAAAGTPGREIELSGENLRAWNFIEVQRIGRAIAWATTLTIVGVTGIMAATGVAWMGPTKSAHTLVVIHYCNNFACGELVGADQRQVLIKSIATKVVSLVPAATISELKIVKGC